MTLRLRARRALGGASSRPIRAPVDLTELIEQGPDGRSRALLKRIETTLVALGCWRSGSGPELLADLDGALSAGGPHEAWLALAVITGRLPVPAEVQRLVRTIRLEGPLPGLLAALGDHDTLETSDWPEVEVVTGQVLVDLHDTARNPYSTGIQRVARETARRWTQGHEVILVGSTDDFTAYRRLSEDESRAALYGVRPSTDPVGKTGTLLVPWKCVHLVPELPAELEQAPRYQALAMFSCSRTGLVGHDCIAITASEVTAEGMPMRFARFLAVAACVDRIATTCVASQLEFQGWRTMLAGAGLTGPDIECVPLPSHAETPTPQALRDAQDLLGVGPLPMVLAVGSHEPRKNHLAVLHAAELLWREGLLFNLVFVGGNSWNSTAFQAQVDTLRQLNRPVQTILGLPDDLLWAAYRLAHCTVFPSLHEGFGLPVAESLASGTPVITSNFGSMADLASRGGALLVDPRNDRDLTDALRRLLLDPALRQRLADEAAALPRRSWDDYATETWDYLVNGNPPTTT